MSDTPLIPTAGRVAAGDLWTARRWAREVADGTMSAMTSSLAASRLLLLTDRSRPGAGTDAVKLRRYRIARLELNARRTTQDRFGHLKRSYD